MKAPAEKATTYVIVVIVAIVVVYMVIGMIASRMMY